MQMDVISVLGTARWKTTDRVITLGDDIILNITFDSDSLATPPVFRVNGEVVAVTTVIFRDSDYVSDVGGVLNIGNREVLNRGYDGWVGDVLLYNRLLFSAERTSINTHLSNKRGITLA